MHPRRILIVEEDPSSRRFHCRALERMGLSTYPVDSVAAALKSLKLAQPDGIVADISMHVDGIQFCRALRRIPSYATIPFLLMTGIQMPRSLLREASTGLGDSEIFVKGDNITHFIGLIHERMKMPPPTKETAQLDRKHSRVTLDSTSRRVWIDGHELPRLPAKRFDLLAQLLQDGAPHGSDELLQSVWPDSDNQKIIGVNILRLRHDLRNFSGLRIDTTPEGYAAHLVP